MDWENPKHQLAMREPRKGRRLSLAATVVTPQGPLVCYSCHLEVHLTSAGRQQLRVLRTKGNIAQSFPLTCKLQASLQLADRNLMQVFCGMLARIAQFADVLKDSRAQIAQVCFPSCKCILGICINRRFHWRHPDTSLN